MGLFFTTHRNDDITKCGIHLVYRGDKVFEQTRLMTSAEYVAASSAIAQVQANYDQLSLIAQKDTIYNKEAIWLYAELFLGHHDGSCHGLW